MTLRGEISIKLGPRPYTKLAGNTPYPGQVKLDSLKLVRDRADSDKWRLPKSEVQRVLALVSPARKQTGSRCGASPLAPALFESQGDSMHAISMSNKK